MLLSSCVAAKVEGTRREEGEGGTSSLAVPSLYCRYVAVERRRRFFGKSMGLCSASSVTVKRRKRDAV